MIQTPTIKKLIARKMSLIAIPPGGNLYDGIAFLSDPVRMIEVARKATKWVEEAIGVIRSCPDCPYTSDDEVAVAILEQIEKKEKTNA